MSDSSVELDTSEWDDFLRKVVSNLKRAQAMLKVVAQVYAFQDILDHFKKEEGPNGGWAPRSPATQLRYAMIQSGQWAPPNGMRAGSFSPSNKLLQLTGAMRQGNLPQNIQNFGSDAVRIFNTASYSGRHNEGTGGMPQREFMWLSDNVQEKMVSAIAQMILEEGRV